MDASGRLHVVSACLYHRSGEGQLQVVCNALNLGTPGRLLLGRIYYFLVLQTSLHCVFMLKGAGGSEARDMTKEKVRTVECSYDYSGHTAVLPGSSGGDRWHLGMWHIGSLAAVFFLKTPSLKIHRG